MKDNSFQSKIFSAAKWSSLTEIAAKLVSPITNIILARILVPEAFGVVTTVTMIISFADMLTDSGFQKYLVQREFKDEEEKYKYANVAFWTNFGLSVLIWVIIFLLREPIADMVGNPGLGNVLAIASLQLLFTSFSSIQMALYRRSFDFKTLFVVRMVSVGIPFIITIPLAIVGLSYWSLIIGTLFIQISNAVILTLKSKWKPKPFYSFKLFKNMFSFSMWSLIEAISIWLTIWIDSFIIGALLNQYYLGLYKTSTTMVNMLMGIVTAAIVPVLFSALSRLQDDDNKFNELFFRVQRVVSIAIFPLGVGIFLFSTLATQLLLGSQWNEASDIIGIWALTSSIQIVLAHFSSEVYRSKGRPKLSFLAQVLHLIVLVPACLISSHYGFWALVYTRSLIRFQGVIVHFLIMKIALGFPVTKIFKNVLPTSLSAFIMGIIGYFLSDLDDSLIWKLISILICVIIYFTVLLLFPNIRKELNVIINRVLPPKLKRKLIYK